MSIIYFKIPGFLYKSKIMQLLENKIQEELAAFFSIKKYIICKALRNNKKAFYRNLLI